jgi:hypothetical protein
MDELNWRAKDIGTIGEFLSVAECDECTGSVSQKGLRTRRSPRGAGRSSALFPRQDTLRATGHGERFGATETRLPSAPP